MNVTIEIHTVQINDNTALIIQLLRDDAERLIAEFNVQITLEIEWRIHELTLSWEQHYEVTVLEISIYW